ncbi:MAG: class I mannose-6-phosphate isomerase [Armatimonadota bacterium]|nr:class I mannose-6-phosphate isomerase [Armatimonadota bacterium]
MGYTGAGQAARSHERALHIYPIKFEEVFFERVWGGTGLARALGKALPPGVPVGESWEIADHPSAVSVVRNGPYAGRLLSNLREEFGMHLAGPRALTLGRGRLPLLIKFLDCHDRLSVQVHPNDAFAAAVKGGSLGKTEMWYVVDARPGARLWCGLKPGIDRAALQRAIAEGRVAETLQEFPVAPGDSFFIPAGRVHALGEGLLICEIQQNSDVTYRFYDWDRVGLDGKPRPLHVERSLEAIAYEDTRDPRCQPRVAEVPGAAVEQLVECPQFVAEKVTVTGRYHTHTHGTTFHTLSAVEGEGLVCAGEGPPEPLRRGESMLIPCAAGPYSIEATGKLTLLRAWVP